MKTTTYIVLTLAASVAAQADFSYTTTQKAPTGMMGATVAPTVTKHLLKGQKLKTDNGDNVMIMDFDAQTMTSVNHTRKVYSVMKFSDLGAGIKNADVETKIDLKETGQKKRIGAYDASEVIMTMEVESPMSAQGAMKMQMEVEMWLSTDVPGAKEMKAFYQKNSGAFPWAAMSGGVGGMQKAVADIQKKMANIGGVSVLQITRMKAGGAAAQMAAGQPGMAQAKAQLEAMVAKGGPGAEMAKQQLARMNAMSSGGALIEITAESSGFSTSAIADSEFVIPAGYTKQDSPLGRGGATAPPPRPR